MVRIVVLSIREFSKIEIYGIVPELIDWCDITVMKAHTYQEVDTNSQGCKSFMATDLRARKSYIAQLAAQRES